MKKYNIMFFYLVCASYLYYVENETVMTDLEYDLQIKEVYKNKDKLTLKNCFLKQIDLKLLEKSTSLFYINQYPTYLKQQARKWLALSKGE